MRSILSWVDHLQEEDGTTNAIYDVAFKPDGTELLVAAGIVVSIYDPNEGTLLQSLKGHKDNVYCVAYAYNGERYASGGADKSVIIWTHEHEGVLKFNHNEAVQCLAFSPTSTILISCAMTDFGMWSLDSKSVTKHKVSSRICSCDWAKDGQYFALGMFNGVVSIRTKACEERSKIERPEASPIWTLSFNHIADDGSKLLAIGDWNKTLSFYREEGQSFTLQNEGELDFDPCSLDFFAFGEYLVLGGSSSQVTIFTADANKLGLLSEQESWVWVCKAKPRSHFIMVGCQDGTLACYQIVFSTVHGLHKDRYGFRDNMTDVVVQHLLQDRSTSIKCKDLVKKVAIYGNICAIQLSGKIVVYEMSQDEDAGEGTMVYKAKERILRNLECSLLVVCAHNIILCQEKRLQCYDFRGLKQREWQMDALIRYIKVVGGPPGAEVLLIGLKNGQVMRTFLDNPFPALILQISTAVRCLDISAKRSRIAVVDDNSTCLVYDMKTKELLYQEPSANSVAWNTQTEDLLCYSGSGNLHTKAGDLPIYKQPLQGFVVGFSGSKVFCLHLYSMSAVEVPLSHQLYQYIAKKQFQKAYQIACLGVPESDWLLLATESLISLELETAKMAFIRSRNLRFLELINTIEEKRRRGESNSKSYLAEIHAYQGNLDAAAQTFKEMGMEQRAMDMFTDLRMFDKAQQMLGASGASQKQLIRKRADWAANTNEPKLAAEMYISAGDYQRAVVLIFQHNFMDMLVQLTRNLDRTEHEVLKQCADYFTKQERYDLAADVYKKIDDKKSLIGMYIEAKMWPEAFECGKDDESLLPDIYLPYANWLAENDRFEDAQKARDPPESCSGIEGNNAERRSFWLPRAFHKAGKIERALYVLEQLTVNAVQESRFNDAAYYYWMLSLQYLERSQEDPSNHESHLTRFRECQKLADLYYAYNAVHRYTAEPFTSYQAEALFNIARFLINSMGTESPRGISIVSTLYTLAKQSQRLELHKLARIAYDRLQGLRAPPRFQQVIELGALIARSKPFHDSEEMVPICYKCSATNPMLSNIGAHECVKCGHPFIVSFVSFETLPVIEFITEPGITDEEAKELIEAEPPLNDDNDMSKVLKDTMDGKNPSKNDKGKPLYSPLVLQRSGLVSLQRTQVLICQWPKPLRYQYYLNLIPEISISKCDSCQRLYHTDDFEMKVLQEGTCPFCKRKNEDTRIHTEIDDDDENDY